MSDCCNDNTSKPGTLEAPSDCFDDCRLSISQDTFKKVDTNNSGKITAGEIDSALKFQNDFSPSTKKDLQCVSDHLRNSPIDTNLGGNQVKLAAALSSVHTTDFAKQQLSNDDFKIIDSNGDNTLDSNELKAAQSSSLSKMDKQAAKVLSEHLDAALNDPLLSIRGAVKNWHDSDDSKTASAVKPLAADAIIGVPGVKLSTDTEVALDAVDAQGRPSQLETGLGLHKVTYDDKGRITETRTDWSFGGGESKKISYDDEKGTQTIRALDSKGELIATTVNHVAKDGHIDHEEHNTRYNDGSTKTNFDEKGRIKDLTRTEPDGSRSETSITYGADGKASGKTTVNFDKHGVKLSESSVDGTGDHSSVKNFAANGQLSSMIETDSTDPQKRVVKETSFDASGKVKGTSEISVGNESLLPDAIVEKDAKGEVVNDIKANWMINGRTGRLGSITINSGDGTSKVLTPKSQGADAEQFNSLRAKFHQLSRPQSGQYIETESPGAFDSKLVGIAPA